MRITTRLRGPLVIENDGTLPIEIERCDGSLVEVAHLRKIRLCRCGATKFAPMCDGGHDRIGFEAPVADEAPPGADP